MEISDALPVRDDRVRRIVVAAAKGGGGLVGVGAAVAGLGLGVLAYQARLAKRAIGPRRTVAPYVDGRYNPLDGPGTSLRIAMLGDSSAAGLGVERANETPGAIVADAIARASSRPVLLTNSAVIGARTKSLDDQVTRAMATKPHLAVIMIGANDTTHLDRAQTSVRLLGAAVRRLRAAGSEVVVGTCPDLGTIQPIPQPLRTYARRVSRELAAAQAIVVTAEGGRAVLLADLLGAEFDDNPEEFFAADRFHPSAAGYASLSAALVPACLEVLRLDDPQSLVAIEPGP